MYVDDVMDLIEELTEAYAKATWHRLSLVTTDNPVERRFLTAMADYWDLEVLRLRTQVRQLLTRCLPAYLCGPTDPVPGCPPKPCSGVVIPRPPHGPQ